jgi:hypothetical protein
MLPSAPAVLQEPKTGVAAVVPRRSQRQPELDALRGILLIGMTLTHLPTHASYFSNQPLGFVAAAEGFIFVSALLTGRIYERLLTTDGIHEVLRKLWARAARLYLYHLLLLLVAFTVVAMLAVKTHQPALQGLLDFYLAHRWLAVGSSVLLLYCPPLLDILPMYIVFLLLTPLAMWIGQRWSWRYVLAPSAVVWLGAQFGLRQFIYARMVHGTGLPVPLQDMGAFNLYAWQFLWMMGLWFGRGVPRQLANRLLSRTAAVTALVIAAVFFVLRYRPIPYLVAHPVDQGTLWMLFDKWQLGPIRLLNFAALALLFAYVRPYLAERMAVKPLVVLGQSSLEIFSVHLLFCFAALAWVGDGAGAPFRDQLGIIVITFTGLFSVGYYRFEKKMESKRNAARKKVSGGSDFPTLREAA